MRIASEFGFTPASRSRIPDQQPRSSQIYLRRLGLVRPSFNNNGKKTRVTASSDSGWASRATEGPHRRVCGCCRPTIPAPVSVVGPTSGNWRSSWMAAGSNSCLEETVGTSLRVRNLIGKEI